MWSSERAGGSGRRASAVLLALVVGLLAAACGFRPLYGTAPSKELAPADQLAQIRIEPLENRVGQQLHNLMRDRLNPAGQPKKPRYDLSLSLVSATERTGIQIDETATRANLILQATYQLLDRETEAVLVSGRSQSFNSYNILSAFYATTVSEADALERGLREIADDVALRLAIYFADAGETRPSIPDPDTNLPESDPGSPEDVGDETGRGPAETTTE